MSNTADQDRPERPIRFPVDKEQWQRIRIKCLKEHIDKLLDALEVAKDPSKTFNQYPEWCRRNDKELCRDSLYDWLNTFEEHTKDVLFSYIERNDNYEL